MGNNLPHEFNADNMTNYTQILEAGEVKQDDSSTRRKTSASVDEIRNLYSALQELVPSPARPPTIASHGAIPEETNTSKVDTVECDVVSSSVTSFKKKHRCSSPLPLRSQPKVIQRKRSNSCFAISATPNSLSPPSADSFNSDRKSSNSPTESQRMNEELSNLIESFGKEKISRVKGEINDHKSDGSEVEKSWSKRRHSGGDLLEERRERLKDPRFRARRRSIGGSLLLNAIIESDSSRHDSLANALSIIARKDELQEIFQKSQENSEHENEKSGVVESFDVLDGIPKQQKSLQKSPDSLVCLPNEKESDGNSSGEKEKNTDVKTPAKVGAEMHDLLEALQELVVTGEGTTPAASSQTSSRRTSWVEKSSPKRRESLDELEAFFKNKLDEISEKENDETNSKCAQTKMEIATKTLQVRNTNNSNHKKETTNKNRLRKSSSIERNTGASSIHRSQSTVQFLSLTRLDKARLVRGRRASVQIEVNRAHLGRSNSTFEVLSSQRKENKVAAMLNNSVSSRSRRRKSDIPIVRREEVLFESTDEDEARKRALWKEDQKVFAKQVNQRLQDWLERATALSLSAAEDESTPQIPIDSNPENSKDDNVKTKRAKFAMKKAFQGRVKRSKSLHNILEPKEIQDEKPKTRSPLIERSKQNIRDKLGRLRIPRSKSMHNIAAMIPKVEKTETKSIESDAESTESSSCNIRRSTIWCDDDSLTEMVPKVKTIDISGENLNIDHFSRRRSCPTPNNFVNNSIDSKRISRLPVDLPLFYAPGTEPSNLRIQKKVENCRQNSSEKENKMPRISKALFPVKREIKKEMFYNEDPSQLFPRKLSQSMKEMSIAQTKTSEGHYLMLQNYDSSKLSFVSNDFESFEEFRDRTKSTESEDSGCPNTS